MPSWCISDLLRIEKTNLELSLHTHYYYTIYFQVWETWAGSLIGPNAKED